MEITKPEEFYGIFERYIPVDIVTESHEIEGKHTSETYVVLKNTHSYVGLDGTEEHTDILKTIPMGKEFRTAMIRAYGVKGKSGSVIVTATKLKNLKGDVYYDYVFIT